MYTFSISCKHIEKCEEEKQTYVQNTNKKFEDIEGVIISRVIEEGNGRKGKHWSTKQHRENELRH